MESTTLHAGNHNLLTGKHNLLAGKHRIFETWE
jgi:hypothetical protein